MNDSHLKDNRLWREKLNPDEYLICREKGTEPAFTGALLDNKATGRYLCKCCKAELFGSESKFDSGSGWPSFFEARTNHAIVETPDTSHGMIRTEITCNRCDSHLGHVFPDGPEPTGLRYCVNSLSLDFSEKGAESLK